MNHEWITGLLIYTGVGLATLGSGEVGYGMGHQVCDVNRRTVTDDAPALLQKLTGGGISSQGEVEMAIGQVTLMLGAAAILSGNSISPNRKTPAKS